MALQISSTERTPDQPEELLARVSASVASLGSDLLDGSESDETVALFEELSGAVADFRDSYCRVSRTPARAVRRQIVAGALRSSNRGHRRAPGRRGVRRRGSRRTSLSRAGPDDPDGDPDPGCLTALPPAAGVSKGAASW